MLLNGFQSSSFWGMMYIKVPRNGTTISEGGRVRLETTPMSCNPEAHVELSESKQENNSLKYILWFVVAIGGVELICIAMGWWYMYKNKGSSAEEKERKHRLLVYEYMERGSLAVNLSARVLDWKKRFEIAVGTAKGLAYLHEECLEWVLHCDVKPQNILLDAHYHPKVADFGLSKLRDRNSLNDSSFSRVRGTRGYMAPEWILNQPITSKVDVYSYGIVLLEAVTGRSSLGFNVDNENNVNNEGRGKGFHNLVAWVRDIMCAADAREGRIQEIMDPMIDHTDDDLVKMELLVMVALNCVEEDRDGRPTMRQVVEMLLRDENNS
ncbi:hypothetical protein AAC387_Pa11g0102 [Persea americana]